MTKRLLNTNIKTSKTLLGKHQAHLNGFLISEGNFNNYRNAISINTMNKTLLRRLYQFWNYELEIVLYADSEYNERIRKSLIKQLVETIEKYL